MIRWVDRLLEISAEPERYSRNEDRAEAQELYREARAVYERIARTAAEVWGDQ
jgi:predicted trehalose synthase